MDLSVNTPSRESEIRPLKHCVDWDFTDEVESLLVAYRDDAGAIEVDFRKLVALGSGVDRHTHLIHPYPAKLLLNIPLFFINARQLSPPGGVVYDPFCGSGTVLLEALLSGRRCIGGDANPLARQIAQAKTTWLDPSSLRGALNSILNCDAKPVPFSAVLDVSRWYSDQLRTDMSKLLGAIRTSCQGDVKNFMEVCFSACVKRLSSSDPRLSVPVRLKDEALIAHLESIPKVLDLFARVVRQNIARIGQLPAEARPIEILQDARDHLDASSLPDVDLVITSPPYAGAQKYIRASSLSLGWLGLAPDAKLRNLERKNIGREHFSRDEISELNLDDRIGASEILHEIREINSIRAHIAGKYLEEMADAADAIVGRMKPGAHLVLIAGDNEVCGKTFRTTLFLRRIFELRGLTTKLELVDTIKSRGLMTKRNRSAGKIEREHVFVLAKPIWEN
ncbi:DNA methyltransferase [Rhizobium aegyptiacum]|uniref:DNA methyltransferase n=1 Tax=Rhizobium aegyptiacum TaxID=1764550 RepID=UPI000B177697|nr:DNA methyltransferase [Rhizobium aegyptiacum]